MTNFLLLFSLLASLTAPPKTALVSFYQHGCRGYCPSYRLTVYQNCTVEYEGLRNVKKPGKLTVKLTGAELRRLKAALKRTNVWQYPEQIESQVADAPTATITVYRTGGRQHAVTGSIDRPRPLLDLEALIKDLVEKHGIPLREGVDPNAPTGGEAFVTVLLEPDVNAGNWLARVEELRVQLVRRLGEENRWLVSYDPKEVSEKSFVELLGGIDGALEVKPHRE